MNLTIKMEVLLVFKKKRLSRRKAFVNLLSVEFSISSESGQKLNLIVIIKEKLTSQKHIAVGKATGIVFPP